MAGSQARLPEASSLAAGAVMRGNRGKDTKPERALRSTLHRRGLRFRKNCQPTREVACRADLVFVAAKVAVFVDGCFWHCCPQHGTSPRTNARYWAAKLEANVARDRRNTALLHAAGWTVVRIWEHEDVIEAAGRVERAVRRRNQSELPLGGPGTQRQDLIG